MARTMVTEHFASGMFFRRLLILLLVCALTLVVLVVQTGRLTIAQGDELRAEAQSRLVRSNWRPASRGRIVDRNGRVLAHDRPSYAVVVDYEVITGRWVERHAGRTARRTHAEAWPSLSPEQRRKLTLEYRDQLELMVEGTWDFIAAQTGTPRREIDERRDRIVAQVEGMYEHIVESRIERELQRIRSLQAGRELTTEVEESVESRASRPILEQRVAHTLVAEIPDEVGFALLRASRQPSPEFPDLPMYPGLEVSDDGARVYPLDEQTVTLDRSRLPGPLSDSEPVDVTVNGIAAHLVGWMRHRVYEEDVTRRAGVIESDAALRDRSVDLFAEREIDRGRYFPGDRVGSAGLEKTLEDTLRGLRGIDSQRLDTGERKTTDPTAGLDIQLTIDAELQARVRAVLDPAIGLAKVQPWHTNEKLPLGTPLNGAAVVIDVPTGEILAMVSTPAIKRDVLATDPQKILEDELNRPLINRAASAPYPPGSIVKPMMLPGAVKLGKFPASLEVLCEGHLLPDKPRSYRCWVYKRFGRTHAGEFAGPIDAAQAIKVSCNIYYYTIGREIGSDGIASIYRDYGVGSDFGLPLDGVFKGFIGRNGDPTQIDQAERTLMGIGQGPVAWTPLHAANAYATLARGGISVPPTLVRTGTPPVGTDLQLDPDSLRLGLEGLDLVVNDARGTAHTFAIDGRYEQIIDVPGIKVLAKTGTAQAPPIVIDSKIVRQGDHSWFVALAGPENEEPRVAIAVIIEYGGSGGRVSGPVTNQIIHQLVDLGYLTPAGEGS